MQTCNAQHYVMHTFEMTSPKVSISLRFPMQKKDFRIKGLLNFRLLFAPTNCLETVYHTNVKLFNPIVRGEEVKINISKNSRKI